MKLISLNVARPQLALYRGTTISTGIFKKPVTGPIPLRTLNLDGDRQADLAVHGGPYKAVYGYPSEHYDFWRHELFGATLPWGMFGENFTTEGLSESDLQSRYHCPGTANSLLQAGCEVPPQCHSREISAQRPQRILLFRRAGRGCERRRLIRVSEQRTASHQHRGDEPAFCRRKVQFQRTRKSHCDSGITSRLARLLPETAVRRDARGSDRELRRR